MTFEEYCKKLLVKDKEGNLKPLKFSPFQKKLAEIIYNLKPVEKLTLTKLKYRI